MSEEPKPVPVIKKEHSYTYWVGEDNKSRELPEEHRPKKVDPPPQVESRYASMHLATAPRGLRNGTVWAPGRSVQSP